MSHTLHTYCSSLVILLFFNPNHTVLAQQNIDSNNLAVSGYDVVEYFNNEAIKGSSDFKAEHSSNIYYFKNKTNRDLFVSKPEYYVPQYGGWCAYAMGKSGKRVAINPESFSIENDKLYLFYKTRFVDTKNKWLKDNKSLKSRADKNWKKHLNN